MNLLVIGGGGREHAIVKKLKEFWMLPRRRLPQTGKVFTGERAGQRNGSAFASVWTRKL